MATGRIGVTPTLRTRWSKAPSGGTTSLSGLDDNSVSLVYDVGYEAVYRNGVLLSRTNDYTATNGTTITLIDATIAGDIIEVFGNQLLPLTNAIGNGQYNAKGALLSASAASTPAVLAVGANDTVLTADSSTATGLKWATPASGGMTLLATLTLTGSSVTSSTFSSAYKQLFIYYKGVYFNTGQDLNMRLNADTGSNYYYRNIAASDGAVNSYEGQAQTSWRLGGGDTSSTAYNTANGFVTIMNPSDTDWVFGVSSHYRNGTSGTDTQNWNSTLVYDSSAAITSVTILTGATFSGGTAYVYGVN